MRLLVSCIPYDRGKSGISTYVREVVRCLAAQGHALTLLVEPETGSTEWKIENGECRILGDSPFQFPILNSQFSILHSPPWTRRPVLSMLWHLFCLPLWIRHHRRDFDGFVICAANRRVCARYPLPTAATVHDLANFHIPGKYSRLRMLYLKTLLPFYAKRAQRLVSVSGATKADMVKFWHCRPADVTVLYDGLAGSAGGDAPAHGDSQSAGPPCPASILYISRIEHPGKNHVRLIEAYGQLPREVAEAHPLVIAGADWKDADVVHAAAAKSPHADLIRFTGFVPQENMERLWGEAGFYIFPSLFEGFGLSLAEAMARGIPCACSNNGSLGEIGEGVAVTFDPQDVADIAAALARLVAETAEERAARVARGRERAARFSWPDHAAGLVRLLTECGGKP